MSEIVFQPWIGPDLENRKFRLLVLGESHYGNIPDKELRGFTKFIVESYLNYKKGEDNHVPWMNTFTRFYNIVNSNTKNPLNVFEFWNSIIFYNFIQNPISNPRVSPTQEDFLKSQNAFLEVLGAHNPDFIVVWGHRLWNYLPEEIVQLDPKSKKFYVLVKGKRIEIIHVYHPSSSAFSYDYWKSRKIELTIS